MAKNDFLEGIRKGLVAYMQTKQWREQMESTNLQQEMARMQMEQMQRKANPAPFKPAEVPGYSYAPTPTGGQYLKTQGVEPPEQPKAWKPTTKEDTLAFEKQRYIDRLEAEQKYGKGQGRSGGSSTGGGGPKIKQETAIKMANDLIEKMIKGGKDETISPESQPYYTRVLQYIMSDPDGYSRAIGFLRYQAIYDTGQYPELDDPGLSQPLEIQGSNGEMIQIDPHAYIEAIATEPGATDADITNAISFVINYYGQKGMLQNPTKQFIQGPRQPTSEKVMNALPGASNIKWRR